MNEAELMVCDTLMNLEKRLYEHECAVVGVSGGSDSNVIIHMIATELRKYLPKIHFLFVDTGFEYAATRRHLKYMEERYDIKLERIKGEPIPYVVKRHGMPILSKDFSSWVKDAQRGMPYAIKKIEKPSNESFALSPKEKALAKYLIENKVPVSKMCCTLSKKNPNKKYMKEIGADLSITGERKIEGGREQVRTKDASNWVKTMTNTCRFGGGITTPKIGTRKVNRLSIRIVTKYGA